MRDDYSAVIFDPDNTLIDRDAAHRACAEHLVSKYLASRGPEVQEKARNPLMDLDDSGYRDREEFCRLLLSRQSLKRAVDRTTNLAYLIEEATGRHYAIEQDQLFRAGEVEHSVTA